ncbi:MAG: spore coat U domain-containing protein [Pseudomonadota bacterium]
MPAILIAALTPAPGWAATTSGTFNVTASVVATCSVSATDVAFGTYTGAQLDGSGSISVTCTNLLPYTVELNAGIGAGSTVASRLMTGPSSQTISYSLYQNAGRTTLWGTTAATQSVAGTGIGTAQALTVYGRAPAAQTPGVGSYSDTITVTVTY